MARLLAIDDDLKRYSYLDQLLRPMNINFSVATCRECVETMIVGADTILLDFDLDGKEYCADCDGWIDVHNSSEYLELIISKKVPVIITSCSTYPNRKFLFNQLDRNNVPVIEMPADHLHVEYEWIGYLWTQKVI